MTEQGLGVAAFRLSWSMAMLACLAVSACTVTTNGTPAGTAMTVRTPGTLPPVTAPPPRAAAPPPSGTFAGVGTLNGSMGHGCRQQMPIRNFVVTGNRARFQGFRGTIQPDGYVQMQAGSRYLYGYFDGGRFVGHYWQPHPVCTYDLVLDHVG